MLRELAQHCGHADILREQLLTIPGKGSGQLKKRVLRFLDQKHSKQLYHRVEKDSDNWGRLFIHFRFDVPRGRSRR